MKFQELVMSRQACRKYTNEPVERAKLEAIANLARFAPSACNRQPWRMHVVTGEKAKEVGACLRDNNMNSFTEKVTSYIVLGEIRSKETLSTGTRHDKDLFVRYDVGELAAYITLAAKDMGVETCIIGWMDGKKIADILRFDKNETCSIAIALGYSDSPVREKSRKPAYETVKWHEDE